MRWRLFRGFDEAMWRTFRSCAWMTESEAGLDGLVRAVEERSFMLDGHAVHDGGLLDRFVDESVGPLLDSMHETCLCVYRDFDRRGVIVLK